MNFPRGITFSLTETTGYNFQLPLKESNYLVFWLFLEVQKSFFDYPAYDIRF